MRSTPQFLALLLLLLLLLAPAAFAAEGVVEINQVRAEAGGVTPGDAPGFPVTISEAGSYRLTSALVVPATTNGVVITAAGVSLDLNGFAIESTYLCCVGPAGGNGILATAGRTTLVNGEVSGFAGRGVDVGNFSHVERVVVRNVRTDAIALGGGSLALANRVNNVGESGLQFTGSVPGLYRDNLLSNTRLLPATVPAVDGLAHASGGNFCDDGSCTTDGRRRYKLSDLTATGANADTRCEAGFHMASLAELHDLGNLRWVTDGTPDGEAPYVGNRAWIRNGEAFLTGNANCSVWSTASASENGTTMVLFSGWDDGDALTQYDRYFPQNVSTEPCDTTLPVWCVED
jgi:hypothetical protein